MKRLLILLILLGLFGGKIIGQGKEKLSPYNPYEGRKITYPSPVQIEDLKKIYNNDAEFRKVMQNINNVFEVYKKLDNATNIIKNADNDIDIDRLNDVQNDYYYGLKKITDSIKRYELIKINDSIKKVMDAKVAQDKKDTLVKEELERQKLIRNSVSGGLAVVLLFSVVVFRQRNKISKGKKRSDELLLNILPAEVAEELKNTGAAKAKNFDMVTVLFTDFKNFTQASEKLNAEELVAEINYIYSAFDKIITKHNIEKIKTIGDSYMCAGGLPSANKSNPSECVRAALEINTFIETLKQQKQKDNKPYFEIRIGLHTGPVVAGIVGIKKFAYDIWGDTVNIASRMESSGEAGRVNISGATYELVKNDFKCTHRGKIQAKNKGEVDMYFVEG